MKALFLAGGRGRRFNEISDSQNKCMLSFKGKPLIEYSLETAAETDVSEIVIVVGYRAEEIINEFGIDYKGKRIKYVIQHEQKGLVHAIECSRDAIGNDSFMLFLGDEILVNPRNRSMVKEFNDNDLFGVCGIVVEEDRKRIGRTYSIMQDYDGRIHRLIEKPRNPLNNLKGTGNCVFRNEIFSYIEQTPINHNRGEKELPDLIQCAIDDGKDVRSFIVCDGYTNINSGEELAEVEINFPYAGVAI